MGVFFILFYYLRVLEYYNKTLPRVLQLQNSLNECLFLPDMLIRNIPDCIVRALITDYLTRH